MLYTSTFSWLIIPDHTSIFINIFQVEASHKTSLEKLPRILILHLKYFIYDKTGGCQKTHKAIEITRELEIPTGKEKACYKPFLVKKIVYKSWIETFTVLTSYL